MGYSDGGMHRSFNKQTLLICLALGIAVLAVYWPAREFEFLVFDDTIYVSLNPRVHEGLGWPQVLWAFTTRDCANWHPLTWLTHLFDWQFFGPDAGKHHLTSLALHVANSLLLFLAWKRLSGAVWRSAILAALFALHPLRVESVAWVAERKDVLSGLFFMLTLWAYANYARRLAGTGGPGPKRFYWLAVVFFALGLMSKPMLVTLPFVLLLLDYWPLNRMSQTIVKPGQAGGKPAPSATKGGFQVSRQDARATTTTKGVASARESQLGMFLRCVREKIPFFALTLAGCGLTLWAQGMSGALISLNKLSFPERMPHAFVSCLHYLETFFLPRNLAAQYPMPHAWPLWKIGLSLAMFAGVSAAAVVWRKRYPALLVGWCWFVGMLVPVLGLVQVGIQAYADRYTYLPMIGVSAALIWTLSAALSAWPPRNLVLGAAAAAATAACIAMTAAQVKYWRNTETLFTHSLEVTKDNAFAHNNLGVYFMQHGDPRNPGDKTHFFKAIEHAGEALRISPRYTDPHSTLAICYGETGQIEPARQEYEVALKNEPERAELRHGHAVVLARQDKWDESCAEFARAVKIRPVYPEAQYNWGLTLMRMGKPEEAVPHLEEALKQRPGYNLAHITLGNAYMHLTRCADARASYQQYLKASPGNAAIHVRVGLTFLCENKPQEAAASFKEALRYQPGNAEALEQLCLLGQ